MTGWRMSPATFALGVIAIVFITTAVVSAEANSRSTNYHLNESAVTKIIDDVLTDQENMSQVDDDSVVELQRNQSNPLPVTMSQNGVHEPQNNSLGLDAMSAVSETSENEVEHAKNNFVDSTPSYKAENASNIIPFVALPRNGPHEDPHKGPHEDLHNGPHEDPHNGSHEDSHNGPHEDPHNGPHENPHNGSHENPHNGPHKNPHNGPHEDPHKGVKLIKNSGVDKLIKNSGVDKLIKNSGVDKLIKNSGVDKNHGENTTAIDIDRLIVQSNNTKNASIERSIILKEIENIRRKQRGIEHPGAVELNTLDPILLIDSTMYDEFEEIGPPTTTTTRRPDWYLYPPKNFTYVNTAYGKFGPFFEDGDADVNVTVRIHNILKLNCRIGMRQKSEVSWTHQLGDILRLLTVGYNVYTTDARVRLGKGFQLNCQLQVWRTTMGDRGMYKCQIPSNPPLIKQFNVEVTAPQLKITDDTGRPVIEDLSLKAGATLILQCEAKDIRESLKETVMWAKGYEKLTEGITVNKSTAILDGKKVLTVISTLTVKKVVPHIANYSCIVPRRVSQTILVNVIKVKTPVAVEGRGAGESLLDIWILIVGIICIFSV